MAPRWLSQWACTLGTVGDDVDDLGGLYEEIIAAAEEQRLTVFPGVPHGEIGYDVAWPGSTVEFVSFAAQVPARILYAEVFRLDAPSIEEVEDDLRGADDALAPDDAAAIASARRRLGDVVLVAAAFVVEGVRHHVDVEAIWWTELRDRVSITRFTESAVRSSARQQGHAELEAFGKRRAELVAALADLQPFYCAVNDDGRRRAAADHDADMRRFLDPGVRRDHALALGYSIALDIIRTAAEEARTEVKPRVIREALADMPARAQRYGDEFARLRTKEERRRRARTLLETELGFTTAELVDELVAALTG